MLTRLTVCDFAVVESVSVSFMDGFNIVTGEMGAGKSILIGALDLACGGRADKSMMRTGATQCSVEAEFTLCPEEEGIVRKAVDALLAELDIPPCEDGALVVRRTLTQTGGRILVNDTPATAQSLRRLGALLVDIHGPRDNQSLFEPAFQLSILDSFGGHADALANYQVLFAERQDLLAKRSEWTGEGDVLRREMEQLAERVDEIRAAKLTEADGEPLVEEHARAANAEQLVALGQTASQLLTEAEPSILQLLAQLQHIFSDMAQTFGETAKVWGEEAKKAAVSITELAREVERQMTSIDASPEHLAALDARLTLVRKLQRKYGKGISEILATLAIAEERLDILSSREVRLAEIDRALDALSPRLRTAAGALTQRRVKSASRLMTLVSKELLALGFREAAFGVAVGEGGDFTEAGLDIVDFTFAPNPGESTRPLRDIASSGEMSRVMLALKSIVAEHDQVPTLVFDEIDANIGGEIGNAVGAAMLQIARRRHQVLCITHLPQVAAYGESHWVVEKTVDGGRTRVDVAPVEGEARIREIARMLGGETLTTVTLEHAGQMVKRAKAR